MPMQKLFATLCLVFGIVNAGTVHSEAYKVQRSGSHVSFDYSIVGKSARGTIPLLAAKIDFDINNPSAIRVDAVLAADGASAGIAPLTAAMRSSKLLHTNRYSEIRFRSTSARGTSDNLEVLGDLTIRNVTRPVTLRTTISPINGTGVQEKYSVRMTGAIDRNAFGATGFSNVLGDTIGFRIHARIVNGSS